MGCHETTRGRLKAKGFLGLSLLAVLVATLLLPLNAFIPFVGLASTNTLSCGVSPGSCQSHDMKNLAGLNHGTPLMNLDGSEEVEPLYICGYCYYYNCPGAGCGCGGAGYVCRDRGCQGSNCDASACPTYCSWGSKPCLGTGNCISSSYRCGGMTCSTAHCSTNYCRNKGYPCSGPAYCYNSGPKCGRKGCTSGAGSCGTTAYCKHDVGTPCSGTHGTCPENCGYTSCNVDGCPFYCKNAGDCDRRVHSCALYGCRGPGCGPGTACGDVDLCFYASSCPYGFCTGPLRTPP